MLKNFLQASSVETCQRFPLALFCTWLYIIRRSCLFYSCALAGINFSYIDSCSSYDRLISGVLSLVQRGNEQPVLLIIWLVCKRPPVETSRCCSSKRCEWVRRLRQRRVRADLRQPSGRLQLHLWGGLQSSNRWCHQVRTWVKSRLLGIDLQTLVWAAWWCFFLRHVKVRKFISFLAVCEPPCHNYGVCVAPNSCDCPPGYPGLGCSGRL